MSLFERVPAKELFVSEPPPHHFGNAPNEKSATWTNGNWLKSRFHFSFAEYHDPKKSSFGVLRVLNDDLVQPSRGFGRHPHRDMEIATYIVNGSLTHQDSMGSKETLGRGSVQFMTAGTGVTHSEQNLDPKEPLRFIQIWISPRASGLKPNYGGGVSDEASRTNRFCHLVSDVQSSHSTPVKINQDANLYVAELTAGASVTFEIGADRQAYFVELEGVTSVSGGHGEERMEMHDGARVRGPNALRVTAGEGKAHCLILEMARSR